MDCSASRIPYLQANSFSKIILDYIDQAPQLKPFISQAPNIAGIQKAVAARKQFNTDRTLLVNELKKQYAIVPVSASVKKNIDALLSPETFTITTAHQNNIFTGPIFFIYKILHTIRLADHLNGLLPGKHFVPLFYMGTEDADMEELNHIYVHDQKLVWNNDQNGAVGRMKVDKELINLIGLLDGQLSVLPNGAAIIGLLKECYAEGSSIQESTFKLVNSLFSKHGLVVLLPDNSAFKKRAMALFEDELFKQSSSGIVQQTATALEQAGYSTQVNPREINLFYLKDNIRERIVAVENDDTAGKGFEISHTDLRFTPKEMKQELNDYPERFSPNVILRGLFQETILPNVAFIGGGGELAYWLQYNKLFEHYQTPYPILVLRNSFLLVEPKWQTLIGKLGFTIEDFFLSEQELMNRLVARESGKKWELNGTVTATEKLYEEIEKQAGSIDITLEKHVQALRTKALHQLEELQKKMLRAEKRKFTDQQRQIHSVKENLFPAQGLQERHENFLYYYATWGREFIDNLYQHSLTLESEFVILTIRE